MCRKCASVSYLDISQCSKLITVPTGGLHRFTGLLHLRIGPFSEMVDFEAFQLIFNGIQQLLSLRTLALPHRLGNLTSLELDKVANGYNIWNSLHVMPKLRSLEVYDCPLLKLCQDGLGSNSLQQLILYNCEKLQHLPHLTKLVYLRIKGCPQFEQSCTNRCDPNSQWSAFLIFHILTLAGQQFRTYIQGHAGADVVYQVKIHGRAITLGLVICSTEVTIAPAFVLMKNKIFSSLFIYLLKCCQYSSSLPWKDLVFEWTDKFEGYPSIRFRDSLLFFQIVILWRVGQIEAVDISADGDCDFQSLPKIPRISNLTSLETLGLVRCKWLQHMDFLDAMPKLRHLEIRDCPLLEALASDGLKSSLISLQQLTLSNCKN
ncbi:hypothetical protein HAX54_051051 [Datura stramonium]|uniref:Uncharacterized protein n=1 Tax=Datura stramonium TaxID=4076 RepID=A0ABS8RRQ2_DATST|nr:hypothetical protein [Datura stramonium]